MAVRPFSSDSRSKNCHSSHSSSSSSVNDGSIAIAVIFVIPTRQKRREEVVAIDMVWSQRVYFDVDSWDVTLLKFEMESMLLA